jgi:hypothetical protein
MTATASVIRLVGGPPKLDGSLCDLRISARDRADASAGQFVRAIKGSSVTALSALQGRCRDRSQAEELASTWRALVYRPAGRSVTRWRPAVYRFEGHYSLEPRRDGHGRWTLAVCARVSGADVDPPAPPANLWATLEAVVDDAAARFDAVAALVPPGVLVDRVTTARAAVATCVADAVRLCSVGSVVDPPGVDQRSPLLVERVRTLVGTIDAATAELVELHLQLDEANDPTESLTGIGASWAELRG